MCNNLDTFPINTAATFATTTTNTNMMPLDQYLYLSPQQSITRRVAGNSHILIQHSAIRCPSKIRPNVHRKSEHLSMRWDKKSFAHNLQKVAS